MEESFINDIQTWERLFVAATFKGLQDVSFRTE